ncbi:hypothetical protein AG1IA_07471 [Rhizoctonia solani AG-1 IA]|uniref:Uncharacterized protein n=1 Tax=Thanatephorus cucumeris (strain AG1-IA) TaxID=983506 RepID=L8WQ68_THACA|nr:hypothetical protein AG1IA_07471 [Rhizoctonia solani AG-1 IA]
MLYTTQNLYVVVVIAESIRVAYLGWEFVSPDVYGHTATAFQNFINIVRLERFSVRFSLARKLTVDTHSYATQTLEKATVL